MARFARAVYETEPWTTFSLHKTEREAEKIMAELAALRGLKFCDKSLRWRDTKYLGTDGIGVGMLSKPRPCPPRARKAA